MKKIVSFLFLLFFVEGCATISKYTNAQYAPTDANKVEVYSTSAPKKEYIELAEIRLSPGRNIERIKVEASKLGADAVIITGATHSVLYGLAAIVSFSSTQGAGIKCVAIKFKEGEKKKE